MTLAKRRNKAAEFVLGVFLGLLVIVTLMGATALIVTTQYPSKTLHSQIK